jgi:hypothetical protein
MANPFKLFTPFDWITPVANMTEEAIKAAKNMKGSDQKLSEIDPELLARIYGEQDKSPEKVSGKTPVTNHKDQEWLCSYCGTPQPIGNRKCDSCGGNRSFARR